MQWSDVKHWLEYELFSIGDYSLNTYQILLAAGVMCGGMVAVSVVSRALQRVGQRRDHVSSSQIYTITRLLTYVIYVLTALVALSMLGLSFEKMALVAGALSVGIGFGLQNIVNNFVSGLIILFERSMRVGDFIELENGLVGEVREIRIRSTLIRTRNNEDVLVPNSTFISGQVNNWTLEDDYKRIAIPFGVAYGTDPHQVMALVTAAAEQHPDAINETGRKPAVAFASMGESSLNFRLVVWVKGDLAKSVGGVTSIFLLMIHDVLKANNIEIPFPQRDVHIRSGLLPPVPAAAAAEPAVTSTDPAITPLLHAN